MHRKRFAFTATLMLLTALLAGCAVAPPARFTQTRNADRFTPCSSAPHCVSSQAQPDSSKYVAPLRYTTSTSDAHQALLQTLSESQNEKLVRDDSNFVHATFHTTVGFVDDVTFIMHPDDKYIDVKSSARIGFYDFGVNRRRVEKLRKRFQSHLESMSTPGAANDTPQANDPNGGTLQRFRWNLTAARDSNGKHIDALFARADKPLQLDFSGQRVQVRNACNAINGKYEIDSGRLVVSAMLHTMMACADPALNRMEKTITHDLGAKPEIHLQSSDQPPHLRLVTDAGDTLIFTGTPSSNTDPSQ